MHKLIRTIPVTAILALLVGACPADDTVTQFHRVLDEEWEYGLRENPAWASMLGDRRYNDQWGDRSLAATERRHQHSLGLIARLKKLDRAALPDADKLNYDLFLRDNEEGAEGYPFRGFLRPIDQLGGIQTINETADSLRFETLKDYEDWLARLRALPEQIDQEIATMREGMKAGIMYPRVVMTRVPAQIAKQIVENPESSPFFKTFKEFHRDITEPDRARLAAAARDAIANLIVPAYRKLAPFFEKEYLPACPEEIGLCHLPRGREWYAFDARQATTTDMTPEAIHEIGLREIARLRAEMEKIRAEVRFDGPLADFFQHLRKDPRFLPRSREEILTNYRAFSRVIDPLLVRLFRTLPRMPYGVEPIPDTSAADAPTAYYRGPAADGSRAGTFFVNTLKPETRPKWEMTALTLHEAVPGHHLQIALTQELGELPKFRRYGGYTAYVEGWGLYAESLGEELGLYKDPYARMGRLTYDMWRSIRLVVDTGMHHMGWPRQRAVDFFKNNAPKTDDEIANEIDRYIVWPGQALAYKIGELKIRELRAAAREELRDRFDVKAFHDTILLAGALPLDVLERRMKDWIAATKNAPPARPSP
ncbi:MAG TPA: DUF885 domain-containing protein [Verrucomicrobiae bacterium]|nr:DUF885 domain-containing protein [Verrucomicrobiae bacterium]